MALNEASDVKALTGSNVADAVVGSFLDAASLIVTDRLSSQGFSTEKLTQIELFLAAHLLVVNRDRQAIEESVDPATIKYADVFEAGLKSTTYGQTVLQLDSSGQLARADKQRIKFHSVEEKHEFNYPIRNRV